MLDLVETSRAFSRIGCSTIVSQRCKSLHNRFLGIHRWRRTIGRWARQYRTRSAIESVRARARASTTRFVRLKPVADGMLVRNSFKPSKEFLRNLLGIRLPRSKRDSMKCKRAVLSLNAP